MKSRDSKNLYPETFDGEKIMVESKKIADFKGDGVEAIGEYFNVPISKITFNEEQRLRPMNQAAVQRLAASIEQTRLINPITITRDFKLVCGLHRLTAFKLLKRDTIPCIFIDNADPDELKMLEIDENLFKRDLTVNERSKHLALRKQIYERKYPWTAQGKAQALGMHSTLGHNVAEKNSATYDDQKSSFTEDTADKTGVTPRTIREYVQIGTKLNDTVRGKITGSWLENNKSILLALTKLDSDEQERAVEKLKKKGPMTRDEASGLLQTSKNRRWNPTSFYHRMKSQVESIEKKLPEIAKLSPTWIKHLKNDLEGIVTKLDEMEAG